MSIWLSWVQGLFISPSWLFSFENIPLHSSSSLFLSGTESKCGFNEALMLLFLKCFSTGLDNWHSLSFFCLFFCLEYKEPWSSFLSSPQNVSVVSLLFLPISPNIPASLLSLKLPASPDIILLRPSRIFREVAGLTQIAGKERRPRLTNAVAELGL